jgi:hypothetical protein
LGAAVLGLLVLEAIISGTFLASIAAFATLALITIFAGVTIAFLRRTMYSFDEKGLYKGERLLLNWADVWRVETVYYNHSFSHTFWISGIPRGGMGLPILLGTPTDQLIPQATVVSYGVSFVFYDRLGKTLVVHTNLDRLLKTRVPQKMKEAIDSRRLDIELTTSTSGNPPVD